MDRIWTPKSYAVSVESGTHCARPAPFSTWAEPEKGHEPSASSDAQLTPAAALHPARSSSNPGLASKFSTLGCGQLQGRPSSQQRPLQSPLTHSSDEAQSSPGPFLSTQPTPSQYAPTEQSEGPEQL